MQLNRVVFFCHKAQEALKHLAKQQLNMEATMNTMSQSVGFGKGGQEGAMLDVSWCSLPQLRPNLSLIISKAFPFFQNNNNIACFLDS